MDHRILPIPPLPNTQALDSKTFKLPPLDGSLTIPEIYDWHLQHTPDHPLFAYVESNGAERVVRWDEGVRASYRAANIFLRNVARSPNVKGGKETVVAILSAADTLTYFLILAGIFRAGYTAFPISPRNSPTAVAHLLTKANVAHLVIENEPALTSLASSALDLLDEDAKSKLETSDLPTYQDFFNPSISDEAPEVEFDIHSTILIVHSSGSTAFPKPIPWSHYTFLQVSSALFYGEQDMCGARFACHPMPMYHAMGACQTGWAACAGVTITGFEPQSPATKPNPQNIMKYAKAAHSDIIFCVPSFVEVWSKSEEDVAFLKSIRGIMYGGGPLNKEVGDSLVKRGVNVYMLYGCSEAGVMNLVIPKSVTEDWNYFTISKAIDVEFRPDGNGKSELVIIANSGQNPNVFNTKVNGVDAYATSDLLAPHPTKQGLWTVFGRVDDQIMHSTGEKTNPGPLESIMNQDPHVQSCVMFGRGRFNAGILISPKPSFAFDPSDSEALVKFRQMIWPTVERLNEYAPQHSRLFKEMIMVASPSKPFTYTAKMTVRRQAVINDYEPEINALYETVDQATEMDIPKPETWDMKSTLSYTREIVKKVMKSEIGDNDDLFAFGCDSLQSTWIRNTLLNALHSASINTRSVPMNLVYHYPNVTALAAYITSIASPENDEEVDPIKLRTSAMEEMVKKYSGSFKQHEPKGGVASKDVIIVTGTTGGLGALLLEKLLKSPDVERVYALNRGKEGLMTRQRKAFKERGMDLEVLRSEKLDLLAVDLSDATLGLETDKFGTLRDNVTHIIHNAYPVNFNLSLTSFEPAIKDLRKIIDLALASPLAEPPSILFTSSISVVNQHDKPGLVPEEEVPASSAVGLGYSESKWVCEKILAAASAQTSLKSVSVRIGQMCGTSTNGYWNVKEWMPALFKSSIHIGKLPVIDNCISWIPIDIAADVIIDMRNSSKQTLHLAHPSPVSWRSVLELVSRELALPLVEYSDWVKSLKQSGKKLGSGSRADAKLLKDNPALRLMSFFDTSNEKSDSDDSYEAFGIKRLSLEESMKVSPSLRNAQAKTLTGETALEWLASWRREGFIEDDW